MIESHSLTKQQRVQSPTVADAKCNADAVDQTHKPKESSLTAIPTLSVMTSSTLTHVDVKPDIKLEGDASPSQSPTLIVDHPTQKFKTSRSPSLLWTESPVPERGIISKSSTPPINTPGKTQRKAGSAPVQLIGYLPIARQEALASFNEIQDNNYQNKSLGRSREFLESTTCDCTFKPGVDSEDKACGPYSDCINRLTQLECLPDECRCLSACQNQRFQKKQYASIDIISTEKKGYGLRAEEDLPQDAFIYEYVGDVVNPTSFKKRMREYAVEGIQHFYFMMLQKDEFIDATKSGGIGRFANHSCNPNCYVAKWTVGTYVRMGIFSKRNIQKYEELTFNYNVDRYGHQAQECFCGEPNCIGFIGGKTQTDVAAMDDLYLDALGITDEADLMELKGTKKKKGKKIDDPDFMPNLKALSEKDVPKVVQAIRQTTSRRVLAKLLLRIKITEDEVALRQIMRLRGYSVMTNVLEDHASDMELVTLALECMTTWPLLNRNKVLDSKVHVPVESFASLENEAVTNLAEKLLEHWNALPVYNRIPKRQIQEAEIVALNTPAEESPLPDSQPSIEKEKEREESWRDRKKRRFDFVTTPDLASLGQLFTSPREEKMTMKKQKQTIAEIIANAAKMAAEEEAAAAAAAAQAKAEAEAAAEKAAKRKERAQKKALMTPQEKEALKEKRLLKLVGVVVVKCMSKYAKSLDRDNFKKYARELTQVIADKEKKSSSYREGRLDSLSDEKTVKIKKFSKEYIAKVLHKLEKSGKRRLRHGEHNGNGNISNTPSTSTTVQSPISHDDGDVNMYDTGDTGMHMSVEEAMGMEPDEDGEGDYDDDEDGQEEELRVVDLSSAAMTFESAKSPMRIDASTNDGMDTGDDFLIVTPIKQRDSDPRLRPPVVI